MCMTLCTYVHCYSVVALCGFVALCHNHDIVTLFFLPAAAPSVVVNFNDTRCTDGGGVCSTDSLLLTCTANEIIILRVTLPSDGTLGVFNDGTVTGIGTLPAGFSVESSNAIMNPGGLSYNYTLSLSIENASLLNGSMIVCDDNTINQDMAGCPVVGKSQRNSSPSPSPSLAPKTCTA